jgi:Rho GTPase-activating protein RGD1
MSQPFNQAPPPAAIQQHERSFSQGPSMPSMQQYGSMGGPPQSQNFTSSPISASVSGPPQLSTLPFQSSHTPPPQSFLPQQPNPSSYSQSPTTGNTGNLPPLKPVFGLSLEQLFERDGSAVPMVVYQCIQAVDLFGLEVEGIYRLSGTSSHINKIKAMFDNGKF